MKAILIMVWAVLCTGVLGVALYTYDAPAGADIGPLFLWLMIILTFPGGLLVAAGGSALLMATGDGFAVGAITYYMGIWSLFVGVGYLQWFVLLPWLWTKFRAMGRAQGEESATH